MAKTEPKQSVYEIVSNQILELLDKGVAPWRRPWNSQMPQNGRTGRAYRGLNSLLLAMSGFSDPRWLTMKAINEMGGRVKKGEKAHLVTYWKWLEKKDEESGEVEKIPMLRYYLAFNVLQAEGLNLKPLEPSVVEPVAKAEEVVSAYLGTGGPALKVGGDRAAYSPMFDMVLMPPQGAFRSTAGYYSTLFHELAHSTGHKDRLGRFGNLEAPHEERSYGFEELVAEMGAAMLAGSIGLDIELEQSAAYLGYWKEAIKADKRLVVKAAGAAQKAVDHILGQGAAEAEAEGELTTAA